MFTLYFEKIVQIRFTYFSGRTDFTCKECGMVFSKKSALEVHSRVHSGIRPYSCNICDKKFSIYGNLKRHLLIHTGERPYQCSLCSNGFKNSSHLLRHVNKKHPKENNSHTEWEKALVLFCCYWRALAIIKNCKCFVKYLVL